MAFADVRRLPARSGQMPRPLGPACHQYPTISAVVDEKRRGWVAVSLSGSFATDRAVEELSRTLSRLLDHHTSLAIDATRAADLSTGCCRVLVAAGLVCWHYGGTVVVTRPPSTATRALRRLDSRGHLWVMDVGPDPC